MAKATLEIKIIDGGVSVSGGGGGAIPQLPEEERERLASGLSLPNFRPGKGDGGGKQPLERDANGRFLPSGGGGKPPRERDARGRFLPSGGGGGESGIPGFSPGGGGASGFAIKAGMAAGAAASGVMLAAKGVQKAFELAVQASKMLAQSMLAQSKELGSYSTDVAVVNGQNQIRMEMARLRRGNDIGKDVAHFEQTRGRIQEQMYDIQTQILKVAFRVFDDFGPALSGLLTVIENSVGKVDPEKVAGILQGLLTGAIVGSFGTILGPPIVKEIQKILGLLEEISKKDKEPPMGEDPFFLAILRQGNQADRVRMPAANNAEVR